MNLQAALLVVVVLFLGDGGALSSQVCNVKDFGAKGDGKTIDTAAFVKALQACDTNDFSVVLVPPATYAVGAINVTQSNIVLNITKGAVLSFQNDQSLYPLIPHLPSYPCDRDICSANRFNPCLLLFKTENVSIIGGGRLEGNGAYWWNLHSEKKLPAGRPRLLQTMYARNVLLSHLQLYNSPFWTTHIWASDTVEVAHCEVFAPATSPNTDGVDPDSSSNVWVHHLTCHNGDDGIAVKSGMDAAGRAFNRPTINVLVEHSNFRFSHGLSIGSEVSGGVANITFRHNILEMVDTAAYVKTSAGRGGYIKDVVFDTIGAEGAAQMIRVNTDYDSGTPAPILTVLQNITFGNMRGVVGRAGSLECTTKIPCHDFAFRNIDITAPLGYECTKGTITGAQSGCSPIIPCLSS